MFGVAIGPFQGLGRTVVVSNIADEFTCEIFERSEYSACDYIAFNLGKTVFDLVEPKILGRV